MKWLWCGLLFILSNKSILIIKYSISEAIKVLLFSDYSRLLRVRGELTHRLCARTYTQSASCSFKLRSLSQTGRARESRRRSVNIAEFSGIPRIHSSDSDPTVGAGARLVFGLYFHLARFTAHVCAQERLAHARIAESGTCRDDSMPAQQLETLRCI